MPTNFDQANTEYSNEATISDGAVIGASGVRLTNTESGRIYVGVTFTVGGGTLINELGGFISLSQFDQTYPYPLVVIGSDGADGVINAGLIRGRIALGGGADLYVDRDGTEYGVDLGTGDDSFRIEGSQSYWSFSSPEVTGGEGVDRVIFANTGNDIRGSSLTGFEILVLEQGGNVSDFSGYQSIILAPVGTGNFFNFLDCLNPLVDLNLAGQAIFLQRSTLHSITGSEATDYVGMGVGSAVANGISLGGGDDGFAIDSNYSADAPAIAALVDGGSGSDTLSLNWYTAGDRSYDLSSVQGFEKLNVNSWNITDPATAHVSNISGLTDIQIGQRATLILSDSDVANARVGGGFGGGLTIEAGVAISRYGFPEDGPWDDDIDKAQGDPALSTTITNRGAIQGDVRFYIGDDVYDGRTGLVGGTVYGNAGNDTLLGGSGNETLVGGFGADILEGNGGGDALAGGGGSDLFRGNAADLNGDTITDFAAGDKIIISNASLAGFSYSLNGNTLTYTGGTLTLTGFTGQLQASAAAGGGVQLTLVDDDPRNDFDGDGRSDILWGHESGSFNYWHGQPNGGFLTNDPDSLFQLVASWQVAGLGDFDGDGRDDILWQHDSGVLTEWLGQANGGFISNHANSWFQAGTGWDVAGIGDFDGDGRDDILWQHDTGVVTDWLGQPNGQFISNHTNSWFQQPAGWDVAGIADFDGDGHSDILWRHESGVFNYWHGQPNGGFVTNDPDSSFQLVASWNVAGLGDFDGDGRDDILWQHDSGVLTEWLGQANGGFVSNHANSWFQAGAGWEVADVGDFDGDGFDDILWQHDTGVVTDWLGQANGHFISNHSNSWFQQQAGWDVQWV